MNTSKKKKISFQTFAIFLAGVITCIFFILSYDGYYFTTEEHLHYIYINVTKVVFKTDEMFLSVGLDTSFMTKSFNKLNFSEWEWLAKFAYSLTPAYLRLGGTAADQVLFVLSETSNSNKRQYAHREYESYLLEKNLSLGDYLYISSPDWIKFNKFVRNSGLRLLFDLNVLLRNGSDWDSRNAQDLLAFSQSHNLQMDFQLGNEPNSFKNVFNISIPGAQLGKDFIKLKQMLSATDLYCDSKLIGPEVTRPKHLGVPSLDYLREFLSTCEAINAVSWHQYYLNGRTATLSEFLDPKVFDLLLSEINAVKEVVREFSSDIPIWLSETSSAYGSGAPGLSDRYIASFLWLDKLGLAAKMGIEVVIRQSLYQGHYALLDNNFFPLPDFWISLFYKLLVGKSVLQVRFTKDNEENHLRLYSHCLKRNSVIDGNIVLFGINLSNSSAFLVPGGLKNHQPITSLIFTPENGNLTSKTILLNGRKLEFTLGNETFFNYDNIFISSSEIKSLHFPALSLAFWVFHGEREGACLNE